MNRLLTLLLLVTLSLSARANLTIEITQGLEGALPIAVVPFAWRGDPAQPPPQAVGEVISAR
jgi:TolB protein